MSDPLAATLADLSDPAKYRATAGVPVLAPFKRTKPDGKTVEVTAADLPEIAANTAALEADRAVLARLTPGHIDPAKPEADQPPVWGFWRNWRVGTFGPKNVPCVLADRYVRVEHADRVKGMPFRSAEYYPVSKVIRGVACLVQDPQVDMGIVSLSAEGQEVVHTPVGLAMADAATTTTPAPAVADSPEFLALQTQVKTQTEEIERLAKENKAIAEARERDQCEALVNTLVAEGFRLSAAQHAEEVAELLSRPAEKRAVYRDKLRKIYADQKVPAGGLIDLSSKEKPAGAGPGEQPETLSREDMDGVLALADREKVEFADARKKFLAARKK